MSTNRLRVQVFVNVLHPDLAGGATVYTDLCHELSRRGFDVAVAAPVPFYPEWRDKSGRNGLRRWRYRDGNLDVVRYGLFIPRKPGSLAQRLLFEGTLFLSMLRAVPSVRRADVILAFCPLAAGVAVAGLGARLFGRPLVLNVQDITSAAAASAGIVRGKRTAGWLASIETRLFNLADHWMTISPVMARRLETMRRRGQRIDYVPNWVGGSLAREIVALGPKPGPAGLAQPRLLYAGNIGQKQNLLAFCRALAGSDQPFRFRICGSGAGAAEVDAFVRERGDPRFSFGPLLDEPQFARALHDADYYVITEAPGVGGSFIPSKLVSGLLSATPILAVCDPDSPLGEEVRAGDVGLFFEWSAAARIGDRLGTVTAEEYAGWSAGASARARSFDRERLIEVVSRQLQAAAARRPIPLVEAVE